MTDRVRRGLLLPTGIPTPKKTFKTRPGMGRNQFVDHTPGLKRAAIACSGTWNTSYNPFITPPLLKLGQVVHVSLGMNNVIGAIYQTAIVRRWHCTGVVDGKCDWECMFTVDGSFYDFGGSAA